MMTVTVVKLVLLLQPAPARDHCQSVTNTSSTTHMTTLGQTADVVDDSARSVTITTSLTFVVIVT